MKWTRSGHKYSLILFILSQLRSVFEPSLAETKQYADLHNKQINDFVKGQNQTLENLIRYSDHTRLQSGGY